MPSPVYLVDLACYKPPEELRFNMGEGVERLKRFSMMNEEKCEFMRKVMYRSGLSPTGTYVPRGINPLVVDEPKHDIPAAMEEAEMVMCGAVDTLLKKTGVKPTDIDILVTVCSVFCSTPSLSAMLVNKFKMREDIQSFHLGGMGCAMGVVGIDLVKSLLAARPNSRCLFVPAELSGFPFYEGSEKSFLISNALFRMGGAAMLLSNRSADWYSAKYQLQHCVRMHTGQDDDAFNCVKFTTDKDGLPGITLSRDVPKHAGRPLRKCLVKVAPYIMTWRQYAAAAAAMVQARVNGSKFDYQPDFSQCVDHFCIHAGGYAVLQGIRQAMKLPVEAMLPSFAALREYGNTSGSTTWYVLAYLETCCDVRKGQTIMQIGVGSGMKAGLNIWRALRHNKTIHEPWMHLADNPITEADLPRAIEGDVPQAGSDAQQAAAAAADRVAAGAQLAATGSGSPSGSEDEEGSSRSSLQVPVAHVYLEQQAAEAKPGVRRSARVAAAAVRTA